MLHFPTHSFPTRLSSVLACVFSGSLVRPLGGAFADSFGGITTLSLVYTVAAAALVAISAGPSTVALALVLFVIAMLALGIGNGAVFQLVPQRFHREIGVMTGLVEIGRAHV